MFYSPELLSLRRKGKLARCWLAAIFSEKMFKKACKSSLLKQIDVVVICEEILSTIEIRNGRRYSRFSLYLSSQLMYGAAKILFYQTKQFQDYIFNAFLKLNQISRFDQEFKEAFNEVPEISAVPRMRESLRNLEISTNLHLIVEDSYTCVVEHLMQDKMNFGVLPNHEMEKFLSPEITELSLGEIRRICCEESSNVQEESLNIPLVDVNNIDIYSIEFEKEIKLAQSRKETESLVTVDAQQIPATRKRTMTSPIEGGPKKRSKNEAEEAVPPMPENEQATELQVINIPPIEDTAVIERFQAKRKRRRLIDRTTKITDRVMRKYIENVTAHTMEHNRYLIIFLSPEEYLINPATKVFGKSWGKPLFKMFQQNLVGPSFVQNDFQDIPSFEEEPINVELLMSLIITVHFYFVYQETIRADISRKSQDHTAGHLSKIAITTTETSDTTLKPIEKIITVDYQIGEEEEQSKHRRSSVDLQVELPDVTLFEERNGEKARESRQSINERRLKDPSKINLSSWSPISKVTLTKSELLALMEIRWHEEYLIRFHELIPASNYTKIDVAYAFRYCLEYEAEKVLVLKQAEPFDTIWIEKYPYNAESSGDTT